jgi:hypothetical protein
VKNASKQGWEFSPLILRKICSENLKKLAYNYTLTKKEGISLK